MRISSDQNGSVENAYLGFEVRRGPVGKRTVAEWRESFSGRSF